MICLGIKVREMCRRSHMMAAIWLRWGSSLGAELLVLTFSSESWSLTDAALGSATMLSRRLFAILSVLKTLIWPI